MKSRAFFISSFLSGVVKSRTPQLMSNPTPPGEMTPSSRENAATPPMGNPYPQWISGMPSEYRTIPGRVATFASLLNCTRFKNCRKCVRKEKPSRHPHAGYISDRDLPFVRTGPYYTVEHHLTPLYIK